MRYCSIHKLDYLVQCDACAAARDRKNRPKPPNCTCGHSYHYGVRCWNRFCDCNAYQAAEGSYADDFDYDDA